MPAASVRRMPQFMRPHAFCGAIGADSMERAGLGIVERCAVDHYDDLLLAEARHFGIGLKHSPRHEIHVGYEAQELGHVERRNLFEKFAFDDEDVPLGIETKRDLFPLDLDHMGFLGTQAFQKGRKKNGRDQRPVVFRFSRSLKSFFIRLGSSSRPDIASNLSSCQPKSRIFWPGFLTGETNY